VTSSNLIGTNQFFVGRSYTLTATSAQNNLFSNWVDNTDGTISNTCRLTFKAETNFNLTANFVTNRFLGVGGTYYGLFSDTNNGVSESSAGWFSTTLTPGSAKQSFSAKLFVDGQTLSGITGTFGLDGSTTATVARAGKAPLALSLQLNFNDTISGTIIDSVDNWTSTASGDLPTNTIASPSPDAGAYNLLIPGFDNPAYGPSGYSYLTVTITGGTVTASGSLADGQAISSIQTAGISPNGDVPVYAKAYAAGGGYAGALLGWLNFSNSTPSGNLFWVKDSTAANAYYPGGFSNETAVVGGLYTPPAGISITNAVLTLSGGGLTGNITDNMPVSTAGGQIAGKANQLKSLRITTSSGLVSGTFMNPMGVTTPFKGLYLDLPGNNSIIGGYFLGATNTGGLLIQP
jgi:hypothetical protein